MWWIILLISISISLIIILALVFTKFRKTLLILLCIFVVIGLAWYANYQREDGFKFQGILIRG